MRTERCGWCSASSGGDPALVDERLDEGVVLGDLGEDAVAQQVGARVADVRQRQPVAGAQQRGDRRPHAGELGLLLDPVEELVVGGADRAPRCVERVVGAVRLAVQGASSPIASEEATSPAGVPAHAVGDDEQVRPGVPGVLVVLADEPDVGAGRVAQGDGHRRYLRSSRTVRADPDGHARLDAGRGSVDPVAAEEGAVRRAQVLDEPAAVLREDPGVPPRGVVVVEHQRALRGAADEHRRLAEGEVVPRSEPSVTTSVRSRAAVGRASAGSGDGGRGPRPGRRRRGRRRPERRRSAIRVPNRSRRSTARIEEHEQPQQGQETQPQQGEGELTHRRRSPLPEPEHDPGAADGERVAVHAADRRHPLAVHEVPFVEPRSTTPSGVTWISRWRRDTPGSSRGTSTSAARPSTVTARVSGIRRPSSSKAGVGRSTGAG